MRTIARFALVALIIQIIYGGFVAGLNAGLIHNHWPMMSEGKFIHETVFIEETSLIKNLTEGKSGVQFVHRTFAYVVVALIAFLYYKSRKINLNTTQSRSLKVLISFVFLQFILGVFTLLFHVPMWLGLTHQLMAFLLLTAMTFALHRLSK